MAKKQTRRSISVSRTTYERLKAFCEANSISMSQLVETRVNDFLGEGGTPEVGRPAPSHSDRLAERPAPARPAPRPMFGSAAPQPLATNPYRSEPVASAPIAPAVPPSAPVVMQAAPIARPVISQPAPTAPAAVPMTSAAARYAVEPPPPIIKPRQETAAPKPAEKKAEQIFTF